MNNFNSDLDTEPEVTVTELRSIFHLAPLEIKPRKCLRCGREFTSEGPQNRLCDRCREWSGKFSSSTLGQRGADQLGR